MIVHTFLYFHLINFAFYSVINLDAFVRAANRNANAKVIICTWNDTLEEGAHVYYAAKQADGRYAGRYTIYNMRSITNNYHTDARDLVANRFFISAHIIK